MGKLFEWFEEVEEEVGGVCVCIWKEVWMIDDNWEV